MMWSELSPAWQACLEEAWSAYCAGTLPIGAVITNAAGEVLARGRNQIVDDGSGPGLVRRHQLAHAELNALLAFQDASIDPHTCVLYTTTEPCPLCFGAFYMSGIRELRYASRDPHAGSANLRGTTPYLQRKPIRVHGPEWVELEDVLVTLHTERQLSIWGEGVRSLLTLWAAEMPRGVALGEHLRQTNVLELLRMRQSPAAEMVESLRQWLASGG